MPALTMLSLAVPAEAQRAPAVRPAAAPVIGRATFNDPAGPQAQQRAIVAQLDDLIDAVPNGEEISGSFYIFDLTEVADRLVAAYNRGVNVRIIVDDRSASTEARNRLATAVGTDDRARSWVVSCGDQLPGSKRGCIGTRSRAYPGGRTVTAYNHNKFALFSRLALPGSAEVSNVVFQASSNLSSWDQMEAYNNAVTFADRQTYDAYRTYFEDLRRYRHSQDGNNDYNSTTPAGQPFRAFFFPRHEASGESFGSGTKTDTIVDALDLVGCRYDDNGTQGQTTVRVLMWLFSRVAVANKLADLQRQGCRIDVVYNPDNMSAAVRNALTFAGGPQLTPCKYDDGPGRQIRPHSKYMVLDGAYDQHASGLVLTGSHNYAIASLRQADETLLEIADRSIHDQYVDNFTRVKAACGKGGR